MAGKSLGPPGLDPAVQPQGEPSRVALGLSQGVLVSRGGVAPPTAPQERLCHGRGGTGSACAVVAGGPSSCAMVAGYRFGGGLACEWWLGGWAGGGCGRCRAA